MPQLWETVSRALGMRYSVVSVANLLVQAHMRGRAVRNPVASAAPVGIFASLYKCLPGGLLGAAGGDNQARVEVCAGVCRCGGGMPGEMQGVVAYDICMQHAHVHANAHVTYTCACTCLNRSMCACT